MSPEKRAGQPLLDCQQTSPRPRRRCYCCPSKPRLCVRQRNFSLIGTLRQGLEESRYFTLTETYSSRHDHRMPALLFANMRGHCSYGHSLAPGMSQKVSLLACICDSAREAAERGRGMGHATLWCATCSAEDHRDTRFYEPSHEVGHNRPLSGWATRPDALSASDTTASATATAADRSAAWTVTTLMICSAVCTLMTLAALLDAACSAATANSAGSGR
jgi:hypothetical protein